MASQTQGDLPIEREEGASKGRYFLRLDGVEAEMTYSRAGKSRIIIDHTEVPTEMLEAAAIDGAGFFGQYQHIILPISVPGFVVVIIWQVTQIWNEFLFAVTIVTGADKVPITVALQNLAGSQVVEWNVQMAGAFLTALPTLLVYILLGGHFAP